MKRLAVLGGVLMIVFLGGVVVYDLRRMADLRTRADTLHEICGTTKAALYVDRTLLRSPGERERMLARFATDRIGDGMAMLEWCLPQPFPMARWDACVTAHDDGCLGQLLQQAERSIE